MFRRGLGASSWAVHPLLRCLDDLGVLDEIGREELGSLFTPCDHLTVSTFDNACSYRIYTPLVRPVKWGITPSANLINWSLNTSRGMPMTDPRLMRWRPGYCSSTPRKWSTICSGGPHSHVLLATAASSVGSAMSGWRRGAATAATCSGPSRIKPNGAANFIASSKYGRACSIACCWVSAMKNR